MSMCWPRARQIAAARSAMRDGGREPELEMEPAEPETEMEPEPEPEPADPEPEPEMEPEMEPEPESESEPEECGLNDTDEGCSQSADMAMAALRTEQETYVEGKQATRALLQQMGECTDTIDAEIVQLLSLNVREEAAASCASTCAGPATELEMEPKPELADEQQNLTPESNSKHVPAWTGPLYDEWQELYKRGRDSCVFSSAVFFVEAHPECVHYRSRPTGFTLLHQMAYWRVDGAILRRMQAVGARLDLTAQTRDQARSEHPGSTVLEVTGEDDTPETRGRWRRELCKVFGVVQQDDTLDTPDIPASSSPAPVLDLPPANPAPVPIGTIFVEACATGDSSTVKNLLEERLLTLRMIQLGYRAARDFVRKDIIATLCSFATRCLQLELQLAVLRDDAPAAMQLVVEGASFDGLCIPLQQSAHDALFAPLPTGCTLTVAQLAQLFDRQNLLALISGDVLDHPAICQKLETSRKRAAAAIGIQESEGGVPCRWKDGALQLRPGVYDLEILGDLGAARAIMRVHRVWLQQHSSAAMDGEPPRCINPTCAQQSLMSFDTEHRTFRQLGRQLQLTTKREVTRSDDNDEFQWKWNVTSIGSNWKPMRLHTTCSSCGAEVPPGRMRYRSRLPIATAFDGDARPPLDNLCEKCFDSVPRSKALVFDLLSTTTLSCTNGATLVIDSADLSTLQQCRDCFRPFAPQCNRGRVPAHYHCALCDERVCSSCHGAPISSELFNAQQLLSMAKMTVPRLVGGGCCEVLDYDIVVQKLSPLLRKGCGLALIKKPVRTPLGLPNGSMPAGTVVEVGSVERMKPELSQGDTCEVHLPSGWVSGMVLSMETRRTPDRSGWEGKIVRMSLEDGTSPELDLNSIDWRYPDCTNDVVRLKKLHCVPHFEDDTSPEELVIDAASASDVSSVQPLTHAAFDMMVSELTRRNQPLVQQALWMRKEADRKQEIQYQQFQHRRYICWGPDTFIFVNDNRRFIRLRDVVIGDRVLTADGSTYRAVTKIWISDYSDPKRNTELCFFRGVWMTSHHPVLIGRDFVYPAHLESSFPAPQLAAQIGPMYNLELSGHLDTVILCGGTDAPRWPPLASCTVGKFLGKQFGYGFWTRRSTRCASACAQCDAVHVPGFEPTRADSDRWETFPPFVEVEYQNGNQATFWPAAAESCFMKAGLPTFGWGQQPRHCSVEEAVLGANGRSASTTNLSHSTWKVRMLARLDSTVARGKQQFNTKTLDLLLANHDVLPVSKAPPQQCAATVSCCFLCLQQCADDGDQRQLVQPCTDDTCGATFCEPCWTRHLQVCTVDVSRYACPVVSCPCCLKVLPLDIWSGSSTQPDHQQAEAVRLLGQSFRARANELLRVACARCEHVASILPAFDASLDFTTLVGESAEVKAAQKDWMRYLPGAATQLAALLSTRLSATQMHSVLSSVADVERRLSLQLAWLRIRPAVSGALIGCGCYTDTCFKCKGLAAASIDGMSCGCAATPTVVGREGGDGIRGDEKTRCSACRLPLPVHDPECASVMCVCGKYAETRPPSMLA